MRRLSIQLLLLLALVPACATRASRSGLRTDASEGVDAAVSIPRDAGGLGADAHVSVDSGTTVRPDAAFSVDAAAPVDAAPPPVDAFRPTDAGAGGCTPLPTGAPLVLNGNIVSGPSYNRPLTSCGGASSVGTDVFYATHVLCNPGATRTYAFAMDASYDNFVAVYTGTGAVDSLTCLTSDDDSGGSGNATATGSIPAGATITVVPSTFSNGTTGAYTLTITPM